MTDNRQFLAEYMKALSGKPKDPTIVSRYVADTTLAQHIAEFEAAFPCYRMTPEDVITEGDLIVLRATLNATHKGEFAGIPPTGREVSTEVIIIYKIAEGKIVQHWIQWNPAALMQQLNSASVDAASSNSL